MNIDLPQYGPERIDAALLRQVTAGGGIAFTAHLPENCDLGTFHGPVREGWRRLVEGALIWASEAGIPLLNLHLNPGVYFTLPDRKVWVYAQHEEEYRQRLRASFCPLLELARGHGLQLAVENTGDFGAAHLTGALSELLVLGEGVLGLTWDVGHDFSGGEVDAPFMMEHRNRLVHMHLHDAIPGRNHLPLGEGHVDVEHMVALAQQLGLGVVLETKSVEGLRLSVQRLRTTLGQ